MLFVAEQNQPGQENGVAVQARGNWLTVVAGAKSKPKKTTATKETQLYSVLRIWT